MNLRRYFFEYQITQAEFAAMIGYSKTYISLIARGKYRPSKKMARIISDATKGVVTIPEIRDEIIMVKPRRKKGEECEVA